MKQPRFASQISRPTLDDANDSVIDTISSWIGQQADKEREYAVRCE